MPNPVINSISYVGKTVAICHCLFFFPFPNYLNFWILNKPSITVFSTYPINLNYTHTFSFLPVTLSLCLNCNCNSKAFEGTCYIEGVILKITLNSKKKTLKDQNKQGLGIRKLHFYCITTKNRKWLLLKLLDILCSRKFSKYYFKIFIVEDGNSE